MDKMRVTAKNIEAYERHCETLSFDMEQLANRLRDFGAKWQSQARPHELDQQVNDSLAEIIVLAAKQISLGGEHERSFIESQKDVRRLRKEQKVDGRSE